MLSTNHPRGLRRIVAASAVAVAALSLSACSSESGSDVVVGFYPLEFLAASIGGESVQVQNLAQPGAEPHDMELTAKQVGAIGSASLVVYQKGVQPAVDDAIANEKPEQLLDMAEVVEQVEVGHEGETAEEHAEHASEGDHAGEDDHGGEESQTDEAAAEGDGHDHGGEDPHVWLDPMLMKSMAAALKDKMIEADPDSESTYTANYQKLAGELDSLDQEFSTGLAQCERTEIVTTHAAFGHLAAAYGLQQVGILGLSAEEPSPQKLAEVEKFVTEHGVTTIFFESGGGDDYASTVADSTGVKTAVLHPLEVAPQDGDYLGAMRENLQVLRAALGCA